MARNKKVRDPKRNMLSDIQRVFDNSLREESKKSVAWGTQPEAPENAKRKNQMRKRNK